MQCARVVLRQAQAMANAHHGAALEVGRHKERHHAVLIFFIQRTGGFVQKNPFRLVEQQAGEGQALLLTEAHQTIPAFVFV